MTRSDESSREDEERTTSNGHSDNQAWSQRLANLRCVTFGASDRHTPPASLSRATMRECFNNASRKVVAVSHPLGGGTMSVCCCIGWRQGCTASGCSCCSGSFAQEFFHLLQRIG